MNEITLSEVTFDRNAWTRVKRRTGAANSSKKPIKNSDVETLPAGSGGIGNVPTMSGS